MRSGFTFKGVHSDEFGVVVQTEDRPVIPEAKVTTYSALAMDGEYDFSEANAAERRFYNNRTFTVVLQISADSLSGLNTKLNKIAAWLLGTGYLIFDDTPLVKWKASCDNSISYAPERHGKKALLTVQFNVEAFAYLNFDTFSGAVLNDEVILDSDMPLSTSEYFTYTYSVTATSGSVTLSIIKLGDRPIRPTIYFTADSSVSGGITSLTFTHTSEAGTEKTLSLGVRSSEIAVDFDKQTITGTNISSISGEFFELTGDEPELTIDFKTSSALTGTDITIEITYTPEYVWGADVDLSGIDWGDE